MVAGRDEAKNRDAVKALGGAADSVAADMAEDGQADESERTEFAAVLEAAAASRSRRSGL